jgi:hypothetical protein
MTTIPPKRTLPPNPHPEHLRKEAKSRLAQLRQRVPAARLADVQFTLAREYGFESWGLLMAEVLRRSAPGRGTRRGLSRAVYAGRLSDDGYDAESEAYAAFFRVGVATHVGFFLAAFAGVGLVFLTEGQMRTVHAAFERLALLF